MKINDSRMSDDDPQLIVVYWFRTKSGGKIISFEKAKRYLQDKGYGDRLIVPERSSATVELAAQAIGVEAEMIAKTVSLLINGGLKAFDGGGSTFIMTWGFMRWRSLKYKCDPRIIRMLERSMDLKVRIGGDKQWICIKVH